SLRAKILCGTAGNMRGFVSVIDIRRQTSFKPQPFSLIITIADQENKTPVYDEMARSVRSRFQAQNLALRATARIRSSS
ncbi:hypothetical protein ACFLX1_00005, partial [Chloroflexota bacterium]